jgi:hypothetical protein
MKLKCSPTIHEYNGLIDSDTCIYKKNRHAGYMCIMMELDERSGTIRVYMDGGRSGLHNDAIAVDHTKHTLLLSQQRLLIYNRGLPHPAYYRPYTG